MKTMKNIMVFGLIALNASSIQPMGRFASVARKGAAILAASSALALQAVPVSVAPDKKNEEYRARIWVACEKGDTACQRAVSKEFELINPDAIAYSDAIPYAVKDLTNRLIGVSAGFEVKKTSTGEVLQEERYGCLGSNSNPSEQDVKVRVDVPLIPKSEKALADFLSRSEHCKKYREENPSPYNGYAGDVYNMKNDWRLVREAFYGGSDPAEQKAADDRDFLDRHHTMVSGLMLCQKTGNEENDKKCAAVLAQAYIDSFNIDRLEYTPLDEAKMEVVLRAKEALKENPSLVESFEIVSGARRFENMCTSRSYPSREDARINPSLVYALYSSSLTVEGNQPVFDLAARMDAGNRVGEVDKFMGAKPKGITVGVGSGYFRPKD